MLTISIQNHHNSHIKPEIKIPESGNQSDIETRKLKIN